jgi:hypothetical protein
MSGLLAPALLTLAALLFPAVSAASTPSTASITNATTGLSDAGSVAPVAACAPSTATRATCLAQILGVRGTRALVHPRLRKPSSIYRFTRPRRNGRASTPAVAAAAAPQPGTPAYLQQAYDLAYLSQNAGTGETIAIVDAYDDPNAESDLATYRAEFGLPACTSANGCFAKYDQNGGTSYPTTVDAGWELEISLDLDAVSALCPNCHIDLVEANTAGTSDLAAAQLVAGTLPGVNAISDSWDNALTFHQERNFLTAGDWTFPGITTVAASGDLGYPGSATNDFPAALPGVTAAGGTTLQPDSTSGTQNVRGFTESAWSGAGSGCNLWATKPSYQTDTGCTGRSYSDISADADPNTGMQVYDTNDGGWVVVGGTSEASPLIAAYYAVAGSASQGPAWAYANDTLLNDPASGSNGTCAATISYICNAGPGYDGPTGVGSMSGAVVAGAPGIAGPGANGSYTQTVTAGTAQLQGGVYPNGTDTTYWWEYGTTSAYGQTTTPNDIGSGTDPVPVSDSLTGLSPGAAYHYRLVAENSFGIEYGYDYTFTTPASTLSSPGQGTTQNPPTTTTTTTTLTTPTGPTTGSGGSGTSGTAPAPIVTAVRIGAAATTATVTATIATGGVATSYSLQYGTTQALGKSLSGSQSSGAAATARWTLRNLSPGKIYYLRVLAGNAGGSGAGSLVRFRTSPVTITKISRGAGFLNAMLRCHGSAACHVRLQGRSGTRVLLSSQATIRGNHTSTVTLRLLKAFRTAVTRHQNATLLVLTTWNGSTATVSATV